jgi:hypothetical protein
MGSRRKLQKLNAGPQRNETGPKSEAPRLHVQSRWIRVLVPSGRAVDGSAVAPSH